MRKASRFRPLFFATLCWSSCNTGRQSIIFSSVVAVDTVSVESLAYLENPGMSNFYPGEIASDSAGFYLARHGDGDSTGVSAFTWSGDFRWCYDTSYEAPAVSSHRSRLYASLLNEFVILDVDDGAVLGRLSTERINPFLALSERPGDIVPAIPVAQGFRLSNSCILVNMPECELRFSYCAYLTDWEFSFQNYFRVLNEGEDWFIGLCNGSSGSFRRYSLAGWREDNVPIVNDAALTDSSVLLAFTRKDAIVELSFDGSLLNAICMNHDADGPSQFSYSKPANSLVRYLIAGIETDEEGHLYILYSGYARGHGGKAELWRVDPTTNTASVALLNHSAAAFSMYEDMFVVAEQVCGNLDEGRVNLVGTTGFHVYRVSWN